MSDGTKRILVRRRAALSPAAENIASIESRSASFQLQPDTFAATVDTTEYESLLRDPSVDVYPDVQLSPCTELSPPPSLENALSGLERMSQLIETTSAWKMSRGKDTFIAVIDTGICGTMPEFPSWKKADGWAFDKSDPWSDDRGHGSMVACIAAASDAAGGRGSGVAPDAQLYSCKTTFITSELIAAYEWLIGKRKEHGRPIIVNNSFAFQTCSPPQQDGQPITINHPFVTVVQQAVDAGLTVVFAAGNNHELCAAPTDTGPNSIWIWNSLDYVLSVGALNEQNALWPYSSRGPGQWASSAHQKPDCVAPAFGNIMWNCGYQDMPNGWGTSGAAPQVAGLAALVASYQGDMKPENIVKVILENCTPHPSQPNCSGHGTINCRRTLSSLRTVA